MTENRESLTILFEFEKLCRLWNYVTFLFQVYRGWSGVEA